MSSEQLCVGLVRHLETLGEEMLEKTFIDGDTDEIQCAVVCIIGPNAAELIALVREWAHNAGLKRRA